MKCRRIQMYAFIIWDQSDSVMCWSMLCSVKDERAVCHSVWDVPRLCEQFKFLRKDETIVWCQMLSIKLMSSVFKCYWINESSLYKFEYESLFILTRASKNRIQYLSYMCSEWHDTSKWTSRQGYKHFRFLTGVNMNRPRCSSWRAFKLLKKLFSSCNLHCVTDNFSCSFQHFFLLYTGYSNRTCEGLDRTGFSKKNSNDELFKQFDHFQYVFATQCGYLLSPTDFTDRWNKKMYIPKQINPASRDRAWSLLPMKVILFMGIFPEDTHCLLNPSTI